MTTRMLSLLALAALALIALAHSTPADAAATRRCGDTASSAKTLVKTKTSVVFVRKARSGPDKGFPIVFACRYERGANVALGIDDIDSRVDSPALAGPYVAYGDAFCFGVDGLCSVTVKVRDLRTGKVVRSAAAYDGGDDDSLGTLVLTPAGSAGWIAGSSDEDFNDYPDQVRVLDGLGARTVDEGAGVGFLKLRGSTMSWKHGDAKRTATLS